MNDSAWTSKTVGVLGGMGPDATVDFMARVIALTPAGRDQDHVRMIVEHNPKVPGRQNVSPADDARIRDMLAGMAVRLQDAGADFLVLVCNTAHSRLDRALAAISIPFVSIVEATVQALVDRHADALKVGVMATPACLDAGLYQQALEAAGRVPLPVAAPARTALIRLIDRVKAGDRSAPVSQAMADIGTGLVEQGADAILAGCTEIPLVLKPAQLTVPLLSSTEELAQRTVDLALGRVPLQLDALAAD